MCSGALTGVGIRDGITVVDDYGHHPEEIRQTLRAAKAVWPEARLIVVFQPHRYTRTHSVAAGVLYGLRTTRMRWYYSISMRQVKRHYLG